LTLTEPTQPGGVPVASRTDLPTSTDLPTRTGLTARTDLPTRSSVRAAAVAAAAAEAAAAAPTRRSRGRRSVVTVTVMTLTAGLFGTMALPAFAQTAPAGGGSSSAEAAAETASLQADGQTVAVGATVAEADTSRDGYTATSQETLDAAAAAVTLASQREAERAQLAASYDSYTGPTASDYLADQGSTAAATGSTATPGAFSLANVYQTALQYVGTPYVFGGATPAGFDCSGFVMFVYAQYGISMPHSVTAQGAQGTPISAAEAQPGDVVVFNDGSHDGFYAGNGMILDAPKPGGSVSVRPLWTSAVHYVRFGV
jgi:cell wall-associated NlpC family hydrolase